jgi:AcrR family transcriptional regulator
LEKAAMDLFAERGYPSTTVAEIAARAGVTERTFFRHFTDKREVLFSGSGHLADVIRAGIDDAPKDATPLEVVAHALDAAGALLEGRDMHYVRARAALISKHAELHERELMKLAALGAMLAKTLRARGVREPTATLAAEAGMTAFKVGFERWVSQRKPKGFPHYIREALDALREVTASRGARRSKARSGS